MGGEGGLSEEKEFKGGSQIIVILITIHPHDHQTHHNIEKWGKREVCLRKDLCWGEYDHHRPHHHPHDHQTHHNIEKWGEREACLRRKNSKGEFNHCHPHHHHPHDHHTHHNNIGKWGGEGGLSEERSLLGGCSPSLTSLSFLRGGV